MCDIYSGGSTVAKVCDICGKKPLTGNNVSHSHKSTKRRWIPNLQKIRTMRDGKTVTLRVCTACMKAERV